MFYFKFAISIAVLYYMCFTLNYLNVNSRSETLSPSGACGGGLGRGRAQRGGAGTTSFIIQGGTFAMPV